MATQLTLYILRVLPLLFIWLALVNEWIPFLKPFLKGFEHHVLYAPVYCVVLLGVSRDETKLL